MTISTDHDSTTAQRVLDVLRRIEALHADPQRWCSGAGAMTADGRDVLARSPRAVQWCLIGALGKTANWRGRAYSPANGYLIAARRELYPHVDGLVTLNDTLGYEAVRAVERRAVQIAEAALAEGRP